MNEIKLRRTLGRHTAGLLIMWLALPRPELRTNVKNEGFASLLKVFSINSLDSFNWNLLQLSSSMNKTVNWLSKLTRGWQFVQHRNAQTVATQFLRFMISCVIFDGIGIFKLPDRQRLALFQNLVELVFAKACVYLLLLHHGQQFDSLFVPGQTFLDRPKYLVASQCSSLGTRLVLLKRCPSEIS